MGQQSVASAYVQSAIESAPPLKIIHMLYEGAIRFLEQAAAMDPKADPAKFSRRLHRADAIVSELRISLQPEHAPEVAKNLTGLYLFVEDRIQDALMEGDVAPLAAAQSVLSTLLDGWKQVEVAGRGALPSA